MAHAPIPMSEDVKRVAQFFDQGQMG